MKLPERYTQVGTSIKGGMGSVLPCNDKILERTVAIKFLQNVSEQRRLADELNALLRIRSKHVVQVYDVIKIDDATYGIVQEFVDGNDLLDNKTSPESTEEYCKQLLQISTGIMDIHEQQVIHRDIKPNNMKLGSDGIIKIFDFGLARSSGPQAHTLGFVGTPGFSAPEQFTHTVARFTQDIDTYAFGATALYIAARDLPTELKKIPPRRIPTGTFRALRFSLPDEIADLLERCLSPNPTERPSMEHVCRSLERHVLFNKHRALVVVGEKIHHINQDNRIASLSVKDSGTLMVEYDGYYFRVKSCTGDVFINNISAHPGQTLPTSCVIVFGTQKQRLCVTFDISNPEVVL